MVGVLSVHWLSLLAAVAVVVGAVGVGLYTTRVVRTTSDYFVASRMVGPLLNASAISGEYLSAASFMGVAAMVMAFGYDVLWYPVGYAAGYLFLLLFVAAPLRRFGAYTIPDFAEGRFDSPAFRRVAVVFVLVVGLFYMLPQMKGAGLVFHTLTGAPYWLGVVVVGSVITLNVALGGMKGITYVQSFQFWVKFLALALLGLGAMAVTGWYGTHFQQASRPGVPRFAEPTEVATPAGTALKLEEPTPVRAMDAVTLELPSGERRALQAGEELTLPVGTSRLLTAGRLVYPANVPIPNASAGEQWARPFGPFSNGLGYPLLFTYSLMVATVLGTAGLPHILVRFYTNRDGDAARRTTVVVLALISLFYLFPPLIGVLGRALAPELYAAGQTETLLLALPSRIGPPWLGHLLEAIVAAGAFSAFMSTTSGLLVAVAGALAHDVYARMLNPRTSSRGQRLAFQLAALLAGMIAILAGVQVERFAINLLVGWAFAISATSFFPLLTLGIWWKRLTLPGAMTGMIVGGISASVAVLATMYLAPLEVGVAESLVWTLLAQPAIWAIPIAFGTMVGISWLTADRVPVDINLKLLRMHVPEQLGLQTEYIRE
ncbi:MAG: cation acetate symporter [Dehalococcoidia bacterium]|nr:MAG: cation acetate symporter [Dehalococcoidia bacterium]